MQNFILIASTILSICSSPVLGISWDTQKAKEVSESVYWRRLLHFHSSLFSKTGSSMVDGEGFFLSPDGKTDPHAELVATVESFEKNLQIGKLKQHPQCAFPERYRFLKEALSLKVTDVPCTQLDAYIKKIEPESITFVFSSAYPNNPGSMFGHTFLRINSKRKNTIGSRKNDLIDWGISYAARVPDDENGLAFVALGLSGGYQGQFSLLPYYAKVNEYNHSESRDIWEYDLNVSPEATLRMVNHVWEIETNSHLDYYFLDENCAYILLALLEVARPDWSFPKNPLYVIPGETVKSIMEVPGAVKHVEFRPSSQKQMLRKFRELKPQEQNRFWLLVDGDLNPKEEKSTGLLDAAATYFSYLKNRNDGKLEEKERAILHASLLQRSTLPQKSTSDAALVDESSRPDLAHHAFRMGTAGGMLMNENSAAYFQDLSFKFPYHDLLNDDTGFVRFSQIDFPGITLRYFPSENRGQLEQIHLLSITSLFPMGTVEKKPSWGAHFDYRTLKDLACSNCHALHFDAGIGATLQLLDKNTLFYLLSSGQIEVGSTFSKGYRLLPKIQAALVSNPFEHYKIQLTSGVVWDLFQTDRQSKFYELELNQSYTLSQSWEVRLLLQHLVPTDYSLNRHLTEIRTALHYYF